MTVLAAWLTKNNTTYHQQIEFKNGIDPLRHILIKGREIIFIWTFHHFRLISVVSDLDDKCAPNIFVKSVMTTVIIFLIDLLILLIPMCNATHAV